MIFFTVFQDFFNLGEYGQRFCLWSICLTALFEYKFSFLGLIVQTVQWLSCCTVNDASSFSFTFTFCLNMGFILILLSVCVIWDQNMQGSLWPLIQFQIFLLVLFIACLFIVIVIVQIIYSQHLSLITYDFFYGIRVVKLIS